MGGATGGAGGGGQQKSGTVKTTLKSLLLRAILLNAMAACSCWGMGSSERWMSKGLGFQTTYVWFMRVLPKMVGLG